MFFNNFFNNSYLEQRFFFFYLYINELFFFFFNFFFFLFKFKKFNYHKIILRGKNYILGKNFIFFFQKWFIVLINIFFLQKIKKKKNKKLKRLILN